MKKTSSNWYLPELYKFCGVLEKFVKWLKLQNYYIFSQTVKAWFFDGWKNVCTKICAMSFFIEKFLTPIQDPRRIRLFRILNETSFHHNNSTQKLETGVLETHFSLSSKNAWCHQLYSQFQNVRTWVKLRLFLSEYSKSSMWIQILFQLDLSFRVSCKNFF